MHRPGIEPGAVPWQGTILPLNQRCNINKLFINIKLIPNFIYRLIYFLIFLNKFNCIIGYFNSLKSLSMNYAEKTYFLNFIYFNSNLIVKYFFMLL